MKKSFNAFTIQFAGLKLGTHSYEFDLRKPFFEAIENSLIADGEVHATLTLGKKESMMIAEFSVVGKVFTNCDRCNDPIELPIDDSYRVIYKLGTDASEDENLIVLDPDAFEIDIAPQLYEFLVVSLPTRILHEVGECNEEMMELYSKFIVNANEPEEDDDFFDDEDWDEEDEEWLQSQLGDEDDEDDDSLTDEEDNGNDDKPIDPRWAALKNLK